MLPLSGKFTRWFRLNKNFARLAKLSIAAILALTPLYIANTKAAEPVQTKKLEIAIPEDSLKSVMWKFIAKDHLLTDKNSTKIVMNDAILVHAPKVAEDQLNLPIQVDARAVKNVRKIIVIADLNPIPKVLTYEPNQAEPRLSFRIKVGQATPVRAAVMDDKGVWHVGGVFVDASGGGCSQPAVAYGNDDWVKRLAEIRGKIWRTPGSETAKLRFSVRHPMDTGLADGIPAFFVQKLELKGPKGENFGKLYINEPISENPTITLFPILKNSVGAVQIKGRDNEGNMIDVAVPAPYQSSALQN